MWSAKTAIKSVLQRRDLALTSYQYTLPARRQALLDLAGIDLLVDIGANVGQYATELRRYGYLRRILSVEPLEAAFRELSVAAERDPLWDARRYAVGASEGSIDLHVSENTIFSSVLPVLPDAISADPRAAAARIERVPVVTLDSLLDHECAGRPDKANKVAIKMDVQGFERAVIDGGEATLRHAKLLEMEFSPRPVYEGQMLMLEALTRVHDLGFMLALTENLLREPTTGASLQFNGVFLRSD